MRGKGRAIMTERQQNDKRSYSERLRGYTTEELEDIYYRMDILEQPWHHGELTAELSRRKLAPTEPHAAPTPQDFGPWLQRLPIIRRHTVLYVVVMVTAVLLASVLMTLICLSPIWAFAVPGGFLGIQTAIVYLSIAPLGPVFGFLYGYKVGGRRFSAVALLGVMGALLLFNATGAPSLIIHSVLTERSNGGVSFSF